MRLLALLFFSATASAVPLELNHSGRLIGVVPVARPSALGDPDRIAQGRRAQPQDELVAGPKNVTHREDLNLELLRPVRRDRLGVGVGVIGTDNELAPAFYHVLRFLLIQGMMGSSQEPAL